MFWDRVAWIYDVFANVLNRKANRALCAAVAQQIRPTDAVLECACGTGLLTGVIAPRCKSLVATDFSEKMLRQARRKFGRLENLRLEQANILNLPYPDKSFDAVVAANVLHLLDDPRLALRELDRVCKPGGRLILPTYLNQSEQGKTDGLSDALGKAGAGFRRAFTEKSYPLFFVEAGYPAPSVVLCPGRIPCAVATLIKEKRE